MRRSGAIVLFAAAIGGGARAAGPVPVPPGAVAREPTLPDLDGEIAWARATWPDALSGIEFKTPLAKLLAWARRRGETTAYLYTRDHACRPVGLERTKPEADDADPDDGALAVKIRSRTIIEKGREVRGLKRATAGLELELEIGTFASEAKDARGRWRYVPGPAIGIMPEEYGVLSHADDRVARWGGVFAALETDCKGPVEWLVCAKGGGRSCQRCDDVVVWTKDVNVDLISGDVRPDIRPATCKEPCPPRPERPDIARLRRLAARVALWHLRDDDPPAEVAGLYRSRRDCLREHPQVRIP